MLKNYLLISLRNLWKHKTYSLINILGLAIGVTSCILILLYVVDELSYDRFHENAERTYRIGVDGHLGDQEFHGAWTPPAMKRALEEEIPEVEVAARWKNYGFPVIRYKDKVFSEEYFHFADSSFFEIFNVEFVKGDPSTALTNPMEVLLTEGMVEKYFGDEDPMGKVLNSDNRRDYTVVGVVKSFPHNSHFRFDFLGSLLSYREDADRPLWAGNSFYTYVTLREGTDPKILEAKLQEFVTNYVAPQISEYLGTSFETMMEQGNRFQYFIEPITDIHLYSDSDGNPEPGGSADTVYIFSLIALGILLIAGINFMNLSTARSANRAREVGIRKTVGATRGRIIRQFLIESTIMSFFSVLLALVLVQLLMPFFNEVTFKDLSMAYFTNWETIPLIIGLVIVLGLLAGSYPAFFLSSFVPVKVLKGSLKAGMKSGTLRSGLVIFQFSVSIFLFIGTFIVMEQLHYIQNKNLGMNKDQIVVIKKTDDLFDKFPSFKQQLLQHKNITSVTNANAIPGFLIGNNTYKLVGQKGEDSQILWRLMTDFDFDKVFQIEMDEGRYFSEEFGTDSTGAIVNQAARKAFGREELTGAEISNFNRDPDAENSFPVVGVVKDFHFESLHAPIRPLIIRPIREFTGRYTPARIAAEDIPATLEYMKKTWHDIAGAQAFEYEFFDKEFAKIYLSEEQTGKIFTAFAILAIFVACLGLLGLAAFTAEQRTKEIGIRKTLGASMQNIIFLVSKEFSVWVLLANIIAWPLAWYIMRGWLDGFAYRVDLSFGIFFFSGLLALVIAFLTVASQTIKAARINPAQSLKYE